MRLSLSNFCNFVLNGKSHWFILGMEEVYFAEKVYIRRKDIARQRNQFKSINTYLLI